MNAVSNADINKHDAIDWRTVTEQSVIMLPSPINSVHKRINTNSSK